MILGICVISSSFRVLLSGFWVSRVAISKSQEPISRILGVRVPESQPPGSRVPDLKFSGSRVSGSWGLRSQGPGYQVLILDYAVLTEYADF